MPDCPQHYKELPCAYTGVGYTAQTLILNQTSLYLRTGHGAHFPDLGDGDYFYAYLTDGCDECCEQVKVVAKAGDVLTIERPEMHCDCFSTNSRLSYTVCSVAAIEAIARGVGLNVVDPLVYDCETRTLSIDCGKLHDMIANPCGDTNETDNVSGSSAQS